MKKAVLSLAVVTAVLFADSTLKNEDSNTYRIRHDKKSGGVSNTTINPYTTMTVQAGDSLLITDVAAFRAEDGKKYVIKNGKVETK